MFGIRPPYEPDETYPAPDIFPTGKKTPFYGQVVIQDGANRKIERMEWGVPTQVPSKRDPAVLILSSPVRRRAPALRRSPGLCDRSDRIVVTHHLNPALNLIV